MYLKLHSKVNLNCMFCFIAPMAVDVEFTDRISI